MPRAWPYPCFPSSLNGCGESSTRTVNRFTPAVRVAPVSSSEKGVYPPRCSPSFTPSLHTVVVQSDAPNTTNTRFPSHDAGMVTSRVYQPMFALSGTPELAKPQENGTVICRLPGSVSRVQPAAVPRSCASNANSSGH